MPTLFSAIITLILLFHPAAAHAQTPPFEDFTRPPWPHPFVYPCRTNTESKPEFHPLRPYPGNPCDPLIPRKDPEAPLSSDPDNMYLTYKCAKSLNVRGTTEAKDVVNICGMDLLPSPPSSTPLDPVTLRSDDYRCNATSTDICFVKRINWATNFNLTSVELPFSGNTEDELDDATKVNGYLSWYLNGTIDQSEQLPLEWDLPSDVKRITTFSGPLNKLYPKDFRNPLKQTMADAGVDALYHDYLVTCQKQINLLQVIAEVINTVIGAYSNSVRIATWIVSHLGQLANIVVGFIVTGELPTGEFNATNIARIFLGVGVNVSSDLIDLYVDMGQDNMRRIGRLLQALRTDLADSCENSNNRRRLSSVQITDEWIKRYVPYSTLEDTTGEFTVSVIPGLQPTDIDGTILTIGMTVNIPTDSRLYFPHLRAAIALSQLVDALHTPIPITYPPPTNVFSCRWDAATSSCEISSTACSAGYHTEPAVCQGTNATTCEAANPHYCVPNPTPVPSNTYNCIYNSSLSYCGVSTSNVDCAPGYEPDPTACQSLPSSQCTTGNPRTCIASSVPTNTYSCIYNTSLYYCGVDASTVDCAPGYSPSPSACGNASQATCSTGNPRTCVRNTTPAPISPAAIMGPGLSYNDPALVSQRVTEHQGIADNNLVQGEDERVPGVAIYAPNPPTTPNYRTVYSEGHLIRNTIMRETMPAPTPLYIPTDPLCDIEGTRTNTADKLLGKEVNATLSYLQLFRYTPQLAIGCPCPTSGECREFGSCSLEEEECDSSVNASCCYGICPSNNSGSCVGDAPSGIGPCSSLDELACNTEPAAPYCDWQVDPSYCPAWPTTELRSAARAHPFVETPMIEKVYDLLVSNPMSLLKRWLPQLPLSPAGGQEILVGRENTVPASSGVGYRATTNNLDNTSYTAGAGGGGTAYFPHLGSISDYLLGQPQDPTINLQCLLRPQGGCAQALPSCGTELITEMANANVGGECGVCNSDLGELARGILTTAGETFHVSAGAIWATMLHEGGDWPEYLGQFTDENVLKWSLPEWCGGEPMPRCFNEEEATQPPFGWIRLWFYLGDGPDALWTAVQTVDPSRNSRDRVSRCNFMDAAFATAKALNIGAATVPPAAQGLSDCGGFSLNNNARPGSCNWSEDVFAQSQVSYAGYCPDNTNGNPNPPFVPIPGWIGTTVNNYNTYNCF